MMQIVMQIIIVVALVVPAIAGFRDGLWTACYSASRTLIAFLVGMTFYAPLTSLLMSLFPALQTHPMPDYLHAITFPTLMAIVIGLMRTLKVKYTVPKIECQKLVDRIGGPLVGIFNGVLAAGILVLLWSYMPFAKYMPGDHGRINEDELFWDAGATALRFYGHMSDVMPGGKPFVLQDTQGPEGQVRPGQIRRYRERDEFGPDDVQDIFEAAES